MKLKELVFGKITALPNSLNRVLLQANRFPGLVYGSAYKNYRGRMDANDISAAELNLGLLTIVNHAIATVPYYHKTYRGTRIETIDEFKSTIGFVDKAVIMQNWEFFVQPGLDYKKYMMGSTGGTSGKPMQLLLPNDRHVVELGSIHNLWSAFGFNNDPRAVLRGNRVQAPYRINPISREYIFDGFNLTDENYAVLYETMRRYDIGFLHCYPSSGYEFANYLRRESLDTSHIKAFFLGSEAVYPYQIELLKSLSIPFSAHYGHSEKLVLAGNCPHSSYYHNVAGYGYMELIDEDENVISQEGVTGEIVGSTVNNFGFPLIRYKTGDFAEYVATECQCGYSGLSLKTIYGRWGGRIYNRDGSFITTTALNLHNDLNCVVDGLQYTQNTPGILEVHIIPNQDFNPEHEERLLAHYRSKMASDAQVTIRKVGSLKRQPNGKFLLLLSKLAQ